MTKEEILLSKNEAFFYVDESCVDGDISAVYEAMDEFSNQEKRIEIIAFEQWKLKEGWLPEEKIDIFRNTVYGNMNHDDRLTIEQLYELYQLNKTI